MDQLAAGCDRAEHREFGLGEPGMPHHAQALPLSGIIARVAPGAAKPHARPLKSAAASDVSEAFARGEFRPHLQPIVTVPGRWLHGFELLARWYRPPPPSLAAEQRATEQRVAKHSEPRPVQIIEPGRFLPALKRAGLGAELDLSMMLAAIRFGDLLERGGAEPGVLHVNLSPETLNDRAVMDRLLAHLERAGEPARRIVIEVTEESKLSAQGVASLHTLRAASIKIAMDDFGQGLSSLMRLLELPVDIVKLDRKILRLCRAQHGVTMLGCIVWMLRARGVSVVAEGIEDRIDWEFAAMSGCDCAQGYGIVRPLPVAAALELARQPGKVPAPIEPIPAI